MNYQLFATSIMTEAGKPPRTYTYPCTQGPTDWQLTLGMVRLWREANPHLYLHVEAAENA